MVLRIVVPPYVGEVILTPADGRGQAPPTDALTRLAQVRRAACRETGRECAGRPCVPGRAGPAACPGPCCAVPTPGPGRPVTGRSGAHRPGLVGARPGHRPARLVRRHVPAGGPPTVGRGPRRRRLPRDDPP